MKTAYEKPEIRKVKLVPSEAVLTACKTSAAFGPQDTLAGCLIDRQDPCSAMGS
ncbi:MAG: hypothetical protein K9N49_08560 [Candidatus Marinimicrobia bacterium]|nr:hypothetical protein [Candidatus Neomarinimicrobiota bacterium]